MIVQTELNDTKFYCQLIIKLIISEKKNSYERKRKIALKDRQGGVNSVGIETKFVIS